MVQRRPAATQPSSSTCRCLWTRLLSEGSGGGNSVPHKSSHSDQSPLGKPPPIQESGLTAKANSRSKFYCHPSSFKCGCDFNSDIPISERSVQGMYIYTSTSTTVSISKTTCRVQLSKGKERFASIRFAHCVATIFLDFPYHSVTSICTPHFSSD